LEYNSSTLTLYQFDQALRKVLVDSKQILEDSRAIAELIGRVHLGARFASTIRKAADRFDLLQQQPSVSPKAGANALPVDAPGTEPLYDARLFVPPASTAQPQSAGQMWPFDFSLTGCINEGSGSWLAANSMDWASQFLSTNAPTTGSTSAESADDHIAELDALIFDFGGGSSGSTYNSNNWAASLPFGNME
jgi:hypothetical protein